jgi:methylenetetrahydrofolate dehydrogenase (NADP+)/methenyltetrahydrofolate cyclohydrolase
LVAQIIDGRAYAAQIKAKLAEQADHIRTQYKVRPALAIVRVGDNPASQVYVASKRKQCEEVGLRSFEHHLPHSAPLEQVLRLIQEINEDAEIHGLIVQLPLPPLLDRDVIIQAIAPEKDVDGLHPLNLGKLFCGIPGLVPCTPRACLALIQSVEPDLRGKRAAIVGASNLVGKPLVPLLNQQGCTVILMNSKTHNPQELCHMADIVVVAVGKPLFVTTDWIKKGAIVIDVGINHLVDKAGSSFLVGDVDFDAVVKKAKAITPVPGGVGPMTVACLLENTVLATRAQLERL